MIQSYEERLKQFEEQSAGTLIDRFLESLLNLYINRELKSACDNRLLYTILMGVHACILTINKQIFGFTKKESREGFKRYLENFVDGTEGVLQFSKYSDEIYTRRNVLAHQWFGKVGHHFGMDETIKEGIRKENGIIILNPTKYFEQFHSSFNSNDYKTKHCIKEYADQLNEEEKEKAKERIIENFKKS